MDLLFLITSVVRQKNPHLSIFTPEERFDQTIHTIQTIKQKLPLAQIVVLEASYGEKTLVVFKNVFMFYIDHTGEDDYINEAKMLPTFLVSSCYRNLIHNTDYMVCKLSGRYYLDDDFDLERFSIDKINVSADISSIFHTFPSQKNAIVTSYLNKVVDIMGVSGVRDSGEFVKY